MPLKSELLDPSQILVWWGLQGIILWHAIRSCQSGFSLNNPPDVDSYSCAFQFAHLTLFINLLGQSRLQIACVSFFQLCSKLSYFGTLWAQIQSRSPIQDFTTKSTTVYIYDLYISASCLTPGLLVTLQIEAPLVSPHIFLWIVYLQFVVWSVRQILIAVKCSAITAVSSLQVFEIDDRRAWGAVALTTGTVVASLFMIAYSPWYLLPIAWAFAGTAWTGVSNSYHFFAEDFIPRRSAACCIRSAGGTVCACWVSPAYSGRMKEACIHINWFYEWKSSLAAVFCGRLQESWTALQAQKP
jgi:hypothetical protein